MSYDPPFNADTIAGALAYAAAAQGDAASVAALAASVPRFEKTGYDNWNGGIDLLTLYLEVPIQVFGQLVRVREDIQKGILDILKPLIESYPGYWIGFNYTDKESAIQLARTGDSMAAR
jgi:hypothetical protein